MARDRAAAADRSGGAGGAAGGTGRRRLALRDDVHDDADGAAIAGQIGCAVRREARAEIDRDRRGAVARTARSARIGPGEAGSAASSASASKRTTSRSPSCSDRVRRRRRDVDRDARERSLRLDRARATRGTRMSPTSDRAATACAARSACRATARARGARSPPVRTSCVPRATGAAGSEISRPPTDARLWPGVSTIVCVRAVTVSPPASASSRTVS